MERRRLWGERAERRRVATVEEMFWQAEGKMSSREDVGNLEWSTMLAISVVTVVLKMQPIEDGHGDATIRHAASLFGVQSKGHSFGQHLQYMSRERGNNQSGYAVLAVVDMISHTDGARARPRPYSFLTSSATFTLGIFV